MKIEILGMGCAKCKQLEENVREALGPNGKSVEIIKVTDLDQILEHDVMVTPALVIDGKVKCAGRIPDAKEIAKWVKV
jgi:small redox-active disulfide protein 2